MKCNNAISVLSLFFFFGLCIFSVFLFFSSLFFSFFSAGGMKRDKVLVTLRTEILGLRGGAGGNPFLFSWLPFVASSPGDLYGCTFWKVFSPDDTWKKGSLTRNVNQI